MMRDYVVQIGQSQVDAIVTYFCDNEYSIECKEGTLIDNYFVPVGANALKLGRVKLRKYLFILEKYINEWSSEYVLILTDSEKNYNKYINLFAAE